MKTKQISWKVSNLKDISDHGLAIQFVDTAKAGFIAGLFGKDGKTRIEAGKSFVTVETAGRVTRTHYHSAIGNGFNTVNVHYYSNLENLNFTERNEENVDALQAVVFGDRVNVDRYYRRAGETHEHSIASILRPLSGAERDKFNTWQVKNLWALAGETGLRAKAIETTQANAKATVLNLVSNIAATENERDRHSKRDYRNAREVARKETGEVLKCIHETEKTNSLNLACALEKVATQEKTVETLSDLQVRYDSPFRPFCLVSRVYGEQYPTSVYFPGRVSSFSHPIIRANYTVKTDGENLVLSSGVLCPFSKSDALAWLKGEKAAPSTRYGLPVRLDGCDAQGNAVSVVRCGCHVIDVARDLRDEFTELLKPIHRVTKTPAQDQFTLTPDNFAEFAERLKTVFAAKQAENRQARIDAIARLREKLAQVETLEANHETDKAAFDAKIANLNEEKMKAEKALSDIAFPGANLESVFSSLRSLVNVLNAGKL
jgi:hypothetical protein